MFPDNHEEALNAINDAGARRRVDAVAGEREASAARKDGGWRKSIEENAKQSGAWLALRGARQPIVEVGAGLPQETARYAALGLPYYRVEGLALEAAAHVAAGRRDAVSMDGRGGFPFAAFLQCATNGPSMPLVHSHYCD